MISKSELHVLWRTIKNSKVISSTYLIVLSCLLLIYSGFIKSDPPSFPIENSKKGVLIDCLNFYDPKVEFDGIGRIKVSVYADDFIEYPNEVASSLLSIKVTSGNTEALYMPGNFWDLKREGKHITFCVLQTFGGDLNASLYCNKLMLKSNAGPLEKIDVWPIGWSKGARNKNALIYLHDVCFNEKKDLVFSASQELSIKGDWIMSKDKTLPVVSEKISLSGYCKKIDGVKIDEDSILIFDEAKNSYEMLTNILLPLFILKSNIKDNANVYHYEKLSQEYLNKLKIFIPNIKVLPKNTCFSNLYIAKTIGAIAPFESKIKAGVNELANQYIDLILNMKNKNIDKFRLSYMKKDVVKNRIAIDSTFNLLLPSLNDVVDKNIKKFIESFEFRVVDENSDIIQNAEIISTSRVYISTNVSSLFHGIFLNNNSILVEYLPKGFECNSLGKNISEKIGVKYKTLSNDKKENHKYKDFNCYFTNTNYEKINYQTLYQFLKNL